MQADMKTKNGKKLKVKALVDSGVHIQELTNNWSRTKEFK